ncbi:MAG: ClpXP protease specificity-enhancing factor [Burkholderiales bacterium]|jgi:stringent starvation protein B|nr:ClpXP protease specificity-enhancing factor [Burkholderiales bacterium]
MNPNLSQTPYLIRALWQWCTDAGLSPQILVHVDDTVRVPRAFVVDGRIVLDISAEATNQLELGDEWITFQARFGTKVENLSIPVGNVMAIYAEETNQGMAFDAAPMQGDTDEKDDDGPIEPKQSTSEKPNSPSPLKVVK